MSQIIAQRTWQAPFGEIVIRATENGISEIKKLSTKVDQYGSSAVLDACMKQLQEYTEGKRDAFDVPVDADGTPFQKKVWEASLNIPAGKTITYGELAQMIGKPSASRAVGTALGKNPVCIIVPCHRIVASGGKGGGYAYGMPMKKWLLELEQK